MVCVWLGGCVDRQCALVLAGIKAESLIDCGVTFLFETIAHEIGHVLVGNGHPNDGTNQFTLPGTAHHKRLMRSGELNRPDPGHLLVKHEWDAAERWLRTEEAEGRIE